MPVNRDAAGVVFSMRIAEGVENMRVNPFESQLERLARTLTDQFGVKVICQGDNAFTDGKQIVLPSLPEPMSADLERMVVGFLDHEMSHVAFSDFKVVAEFSAKHPGYRLQPEPLRTFLADRRPAGFGHRHIPVSCLAVGTRDINERVHAQSFPSSASSGLICPRTPSHFPRRRASLPEAPYGMLGHCQSKESTPARPAERYSVEASSWACGCGQQRAEIHKVNVIVAIRIETLTTIHEAGDVACVADLIVREVD